MYTLRKIDLVTQAIIGLLSIASLASLDLTICFIGEFLLGALQVGSALLNSHAMLRSPFRSRITLYWVLTILALLPWITMWDVAKVISIIGSWGIAFYYWFTYKSFMEYISYRKELSTVIK